MSLRLGFFLTLLGCLLLPHPALTQDAKTIVITVVHNEEQASAHHSYSAYTSEERSQRTGGRLWTERVVELPQGKLRRLLAIDSQPLSDSAAQAESARLQGIVANPSAWQAEENQHKSDEDRLKPLMDLIPRACLLERAPDSGGDVVIRFSPDPAFRPATYEERVLHGLTGTMTVAPEQMRIAAMQMKLDQDVNFGFGLLATVRAGSNFHMERRPLPDGEWKTTAIKMNIDGRVALMKSLTRNVDFAHRDFERVPGDVSVRDGVSLLLRFPWPRVS